MLFRSNMLDKAYLVEYLQSPEIREIMKRVDVVPDADLDLNFPDQWSSLVEVDLNSGQHLSRRVDYPLGEPETPMDSSMLAEKFRRLTRLAGWTDDKANGFISLASTLDEAPDLKALLSYL